jgi:RimJ/RimL family protein N-acetyltransferase
MGQQFWSKKSKATRRKTLMKIVSLDSALEPDFWDYVNQDIAHYYFFILDWKYSRDSTKILLALKQNKIHGTMLSYRESVVQLRGSSEAVEQLLEHVDLEKVEIQSQQEHEPIILKKYTPSIRHELVLMTLKKGQETLYNGHQITRLGIGDAEQIASIMRHADPEWWGETTTQHISEGMNTRLWLGIKVNGKLVSIGNTRLTDWGSNIGVIATHEAYRNRGYATAIVSALVKEILKKSNLALIHVLSRNLPATRTYEKIGFKPHRKYFLARATIKHL